jgi:hypothetical protein
MGQLTSSHGGKRSQDDLDASNSVDNLPTKIGFESSTRYLPNLKIGLENGDFDLTVWEPQQLISTYFPSRSLGSETPRGGAKILFSSRDIGRYQTTIQSDIIKTTNERDGGQTDPFSDGSRILEAGDGITQSPIEFIDAQGDKEDELHSVSRNQSMTSRAHQASIKAARHLSRSASVDDMTQILSYLKTYDASQAPYGKQLRNASKIPNMALGSDEKSLNESSYRPQASRRQGITSKSQLIAQKSSGRPLRRRSSASRISTPSAKTSQEHILALNPSSAYLPSLRQSSSNHSFIRSSSLSSMSRNKSLSARRTDDDPILPLSRQTSSSRTLRTSIYSSSKGTFSSASSLWSPTSEETDIYRINILSNLHFCTYGCKEMSFKRKLDWIQHEEQMHEPPIIHTCLLHVSDTLSSDPCPARFCVSTMNSDHLAHFHNAFSCFDKPATSIERYQTEKAGLLLEHLRERHGLAFETFPDYWSSESLRKTKWWCGFCRGILRSWKERSDHISLHFTREGFKMDAWKDLSHIPFPAMSEDPNSAGGLMVKELSLGGQFSLAELRRLSAVKEQRGWESDEEF